jgi:plasmid rolling circle replication initiator protein Rep
MPINVDSDYTFLTDLSEKDKSFDTHKGAAMRIAHLFGLESESGVTGFLHGSRQILFSKYSSRITRCGDWLKFWHGENSLKLMAASFCKVPYCPLCQFRRSLKWRARLLAQVPKIKEKYPIHEWAFLTLTVRNCELGDLRSTIKLMASGWKRLYQSVAFPFEGCIKALEVTRIWDWYDRNNEFMGQHGVSWFYQQLKKYKEVGGNSDPRSWIAKPTQIVHPHFHVLGIVPKNYFTSKDYVAQKDWTFMWQFSCRIDYVPIINIQKVKNRSKSEINFEPEPTPDQQKQISEGFFHALCETLKYTVKEQDLLGSFCKDDQINSEWLKNITEQLYLARRVEYLGVLKEFGKEVEKSLENLIVLDDEEEKEEAEKGKEVVAYWNNELLRYVMRVSETLN